MGGFSGSDRFEVLGQLGQGGMGVVYDAYDRLRDARVALKTLHGMAPDQVLSLKREFRLLRDLHHRNLVTFGDLIEDRGRWMFTMERVEGEDFLAWVRTRGRAPSESALAATFALASEPTLSSDDAAAVVADGHDDHGVLDADRLRRALVGVARGLGALHGSGKVHRDIKPSNIRITNEARAVVLDFGLVADVKEAATGRLLGTVAYMAPEQARGSEAGPPADMYAVGVMMYEALTGRLPFTGTMMSVLENKLRGAPPAPHTFVRDCPSDLDTLCMDLLAADPAERPTATQLLARLGETADHLPELNELPLTGREVEVARLEAVRGEARTRGLAIATLTGASGTGKTRVLHDFMARAQGAGALVIAGRCYEREHVPFKALDGVIDDLSDRLSRWNPTELLSIRPADAGVIVRAFPVMRKLPGFEGVGSREIPLDPGERRSALLAAIAELFTRIGSRTEVVMGIDDAQWIDPDSLALLRMICATPRIQGLTIIATSREALTVEPFGHASVIALDALTAPAAAELVRAAGRQHGRALSPEVISRIVAGAGGHPLFLAELVRQPELDDTLNLTALVDTRIRGLDRRERQLLSLIALNGSPLSIRVASAAATHSEVAAGYFELRKLTAALKQSHLLRLADADDDRLETYHDRVTERAMALLTDAERHGLHRDLAIAHGGDEEPDFDALARHWAGAGELARAGDFALRAAERAEELLAYAQAAHYTQRAIDLGVGAEGERWQLHERVGRLLATAGHGLEAARAYMRAREGAPPELARRLSAQAVEQLLITGHIDEGVAELRALLDPLAIEYPATHGAALWRLLGLRARLRFRGLDFSPRDEASLPPEELLAADVCWSAARGLSGSDTFRGVLFQATHLLRALALGEPRRVIRALAMEAGLGALSSDAGVRRGRALLDRAQALAQPLGDPEIDALIIAQRGLIEHQLGDWRGGLELVDRANELFRSACVGKFWERTGMHGIALYSLAYLGETVELGRRLEVVIADATERGDLLSATLRAGMPNFVHLIHGDPERARHELAEAMRLWSPAGYHLQHYFAVLAQAHIDLYEQRGTDAHERVLATWPRLRRSFLLRVRHLRIVMLHLRGRTAVAAARANPAHRSKLLRQADRDAARLRRERLPWARAFSFAVDGAVALARDDRQRANALLERGAAAFDECEMILHAAAARLRAHGANDRSAEVVMRARGVADPERLATTLVP